MDCGLEGTRASHDDQDIPVWAAPVQPDSSSGSLAGMTAHYFVGT
jgi:hypothetical protein